MTGMAQAILSIRLLSTPTVPTLMPNSFSMITVWKTEDVRLIPITIWLFLPTGIYIVDGEKVMVR